MNKTLLIAIALIATTPFNVALFFFSDMDLRLGDWTLPIELIPPICGVVIMFVCFSTERNTLPIKSNEELK